MNSLITRSFACLALVVALGACGGGKNNSSPTTPSNPNNPFGSIDLQGSVGDPTSPYNNFQVVTINPTAMTITFAFPIPAPATGPAVGVPVQQIPGATITLQGDANNNWSASLTMPLKDLYSGIAYENPATLPNGKPLPGLELSGLGTLPMLEITVPLNSNGKCVFYLYGSNKAIAIFYPTPGLNIPLTAVWNVLSKKNNTIGHLGVVETTENSSGVVTFAGGFYGDYLVPAGLQGIVTPTPAPTPTPAQSPTPTPTPAPTPVQSPPGCNPTCTNNLGPR